jgi:hypothetical protein
MEFVVIASHPGITHTFVDGFINKITDKEAEMFEKLSKTTLLVVWGNPGNSRSSLYLCSDWIYYWVELHQSMEVHYIKQIKE